MLLCCHRSSHVGLPDLAWRFKACLFAHKSREGTLFIWGARGGGWSGTSEGRVISEILE